MSVGWYSLHFAEREGVNNDHAALVEGAVRDPSVTGATVPTLADAFAYSYTKADRDYLAYAGDVPERLFAVRRRRARKPEIHRVDPESDPTLRLL